MREGWFEEEYYILFDQNESLDATKRYSISCYLEGFRLMGLFGWDDFILSKDRQLFTVPTVPIETKYLEPALFKELPATLEQDKNVVSKIRWYIKPVVLGGDPISEDNIIWVNHQEHIELVAYWNQQYRDVMT